MQLKLSRCGADNPKSARNDIYRFLLLVPRITAVIYIMQKWPHRSYADRTETVQTTG